MGTLRLVHPIKQSRFGNLRGTAQPWDPLDGRLLCPSYGCPSRRLGKGTKDAKRRMGKAGRAHQIRLQFVVLYGNNVGIHQGQTTLATLPNYEAWFQSARHT